MRPTCCQCHACASIIKHRTQWYCCQRYDEGALDRNYFDQSNLGLEDILGERPDGGVEL